jgi:uncharacterized membrane protein YqjE
MTGDPQSPPPEGLIGSLRRFGRSVLHVLQTRLEILSTEVDEERFNLAKLALVALGVVVLLQTGLLFALLFVVLAAGGEHRLMAIGISALVMLLGALAGGIWLRGWLKSRPPMFAATIAELRKDGERLRGKP